MMPEPHESPGLEALQRRIARQIQSMLPDSVGFTFLLFDFGPGGHLAYMSNADRDDMIRAMKELIAKFEEA